MFHTGDTVLYGTNGVCRIIGTDVKEIEGDMIEYLVLKPLYDEHSTLFVPTKNKVLLDKMQEVLSVEEIHAMLHSLPEEQTIWIENEDERKQVYQNIVRQGDRKQILRLIKTLYLKKNSLKQRGRKLHQCDETILHQAEKLLHDEFAAVLRIKPEEVVPFITQQLSLS